MGDVLMLDPVDLDILKRLSWSDKRLSAELYLGTETVSKRISRMMDLIGARSRCDLTVKSLKLGIITLDEVVSNG